MTRPPRILISAGEASGDRLGAGLARAILARRPDAEIMGMGGDEMAAEGVRIVQGASEVAVMGLFEVVKHLPTIRRAMTRLDEAIASERPDILVPIDFPDFNLRLAGRARRHGVPVVYFVSPQVWAWRRGRVRRIGRLVRRVLVVFPFEREIYERAGVPVTFVGHPVVERFEDGRNRASVVRAAGLDPEREVVALLPGSRRAEIDRILGRLLDAAQILRAARPGTQFVLPRASTLPPGTLSEPLSRSGLEDAVVSDPALYPAILTACTAGAVTSGTASLEAAVAGLPMVVVYTTHPLTYLLGRMLIRVDHVAMPNLIAGRRLVPELVQREFTPERVADLLGGMLDSGERRAAIRDGLDDVRRSLGGPGSYDRAAASILDEIDGV